MSGELLQNFTCQMFIIREHEMRKQIIVSICLPVQFRGAFLSLFSLVLRQRGFRKLGQ